MTRIRYVNPSERLYVAKYSTVLMLALSGVFLASTWTSVGWHLTWPGLPPFSLYLFALVQALRKKPFAGWSALASLLGLISMGYLTGRMNGLATGWMMYGITLEVFLFCWASERRALGLIQPPDR